jgi:hypothetical protein
LLFLRNFWATIIPGTTVPLALLGSAAAMYLLGFSLDNLSLMALAIAVGLVVDDAIAVMENIHRPIEAAASLIHLTGQPVTVLRRPGRLRHCRSGEIVSRRGGSAAVGGWLDGVGGLALAL